MSRIVHVALEAVRIPVSRARIERAAELVLRAERVKAAELSIAFVSDRRMAAINREHLGHSGTTDVISFGFAPSGRTGTVAGDIYIAPDEARRNAASHGAGVREELLRLVVHGVLHVVGHEHPIDERRLSSAMWKRQERLLRRVMAAA